MTEGLWTQRSQAEELGEGCVMVPGVTGVNEEKAMATHSSTLAWKIPWVEEPGGLQSMGSQRVGQN